MLRSLYAKLALALVGLFLVVGCLFALLMGYTMEMYHQQVSQQLHRGIASYLVEHNDLSLEGDDAQTSVNALFESVMILNPNVEVYLLDEMGFVVACSIKENPLDRQQVSLGPVREFIDGGDLPIFGDDPRQMEVRKIFSAARVQVDGKPSGYLYIVTGGERYDSLASMFRGSYILRVGAGGAAAAVVFAALAGLLVFALLTRRLRGLSGAVSRFETDGRIEADALPSVKPRSPDEIDRLVVNFRAMAERVASRMGDLEQADRLRRELVANVSHDLRTPLASLQGYLDTVLIKHDQMSEAERRKCIEIAAHHSRRLGTLIGELFELAYLDSNDRPPECEPFSVEDLAQDVALEFELQTREAGVRLDVDPQPDLPLAYGNIGMIERVLENLIKNSLAHTPGGGEVRLSLAPGAGGVAVEVSDTGCGIAEEDLPFIFERFYQPHQARRNGDGVGLGLAISRRILELHGSRIEVGRATRGGALFRFELPTVESGRAREQRGGAA